MKIIFFGTPEFAVESLRGLVENKFEIAAVVTMPDKPAGRGHKMLQSDVKKYALEAGLPVLQPKNLKDEAFIQELRSYDADLFIVIAFRMLPEVVWQMPRLGTFNLHASLLPLYRGAAPINRAVMNGDTQTGVTTFFLKHEIDTGDIISQCKCEISKEDNVGDIHDRLMKIGAQEVIKVVRSIEAGTLSTRPQPEGEYTPAPKIFKEDCRIDWEKPAEVIHNQVRGLSPYPGAWCEIVNKDGLVSTVKVFKTSVVAGDKVDSDVEGKIMLIKGKHILRASADAYVMIEELQPSGKRRMTAEEFLAGNHDFTLR